ncbi:transglutaminaseTgpA domain-containing protein [Streptomyces sp. 135]|uniref:transglutaminaseTgpA domain-containing protein n=1 Tax=Streptomyces sp. 135 TaxID=2838850 RepID=UPI001CBD6D23|nr:transglutaminaseTgpA domain-containing protein [Streptomyces sp. 135]
MSGRARLALCATAATLMASSALLPLVDPATWFVQAVILLVVQSGVGALARRLPLARTLTVAVQALVSLLLLTLVFAREQAIAGILPGPDVFRRFAVLLEAGGEDVGRYAIPAPLSDGIRLMLVGGVLVIGLAVDALAVTFRTAAPAGLPLLALYSVAAGLSGDGAGWLWFLLASAGYLLLLLAEGRDRISQWGRVFGGAARAPGRVSGGLESGGGAIAPVRTGRRIGALALGIALVVPLALPALDGGLLDGSGGPGGGGSGGGGTISAVNPLVALQDSLNQPEDREVITYRTNAERTDDLYLRIVSLDQFDGTTWKTTVRSIEDVPSPLPTPRGLLPDVRRSEIQTNISAADGYAQNWLPMPFPASDVKIGGRWRYEPVGRALVGDRGQTTRGARYEVKSLVVEPTAEQLADAPSPPADLRKEFTKVPDSLPGLVGATARRVTKGSANPYEQAVKLQDYFASDGGFTYNTQVRAGSGPAAIEKFLRQKEGFCVHFSFAMASMARTLGIPARVAVGFTPGSAQADGTMSVGLRDAHAWPELYFEGVGWTRFEPTPSRGTVPEYTRSDVPSGDASDPDAPEPARSSEPSTAPSASDSCPPDVRKQGGCASAAPQVAAGSGGDGPPIQMIVLVALAVLLVVTLPVLPMLWRTRMRSARLGAGGRTPGDAVARTLAAWLEVTDTAWDHGIEPDESQTPRNAAARIVRIGQLPSGPAEAVHRVATAVEQALYAPSPRLPVTGLSQDVLRVREGLHATSTRSARLRATLAPRSAARVVWAVSDRWSASSARWSERAAKRWAALTRRHA